MEPFSVTGKDAGVMCVAPEMHLELAHIEREKIYCKEAKKVEAAIC